MSGKTLQEILSEDLDLGSTEKIASVSSSSDAITDEIDKLAMELGFDFNKVASEDEDEDDKEESKKEASDDSDEDDEDSKKEASEDQDEDDKEDSKKEASADNDEDDKEDEGSKKEATVSLENLFNTLYPEDAGLNKTASELEKEAAEEVIGAKAFDLMWNRFDNRITKIASNIKNEGAGAKGIGEDPSFPQELERDADPADQKAIGTDSKEGGEEELNKHERGAAASGNFEGDKLAMAMRKVMLQNALKK